MLDQFKVIVGYQRNLWSNNYGFSCVCWPLCTISTKHIQQSFWCCFEQCRRHILAWVEVWYQDGQTNGIDFVCRIHNISKFRFIQDREVCKEQCKRQHLYETLWKTTRIDVCFVYLRLSVTWHMDCFLGRGHSFLGNIWKVVQLCQIKHINCRRH